MENNTRPKGVASWYWDIESYSYTHSKLSKLTPTPRKTNSLPFKHDGWKISYKQLPFENGPFLQGTLKLGCGSSFWCFFWGILGGIGHLDNSPIMVTKGRTSTQGWQEKVSEEKTGKEVDQHVSEQPETGRFEPNFDKQLFSTGLQTSKTKHKHTQPLTRLKFNKKTTSQKCLPNKNINLPKVIPHPNPKNKHTGVFCLNPSTLPPEAPWWWSCTEVPWRSSFSSHVSQDAALQSGKDLRKSKGGAAGCQGCRIDGRGAIFGAAWMSWWEVRING